jgi:alanyl-tRNA synthetase
MEKFHKNKIDFNMHNLTAQQVRNTFIDFFKDNGHRHISSSSLVPYNDPSLMFVNSGMVQFKDVFTAVEQKDYSKATTSQKCVRAGGKHNDLENVGYTARHHTFFEMMGNFSFGDYFKEEAIYYAWNLLTKHFAIPKEKLCVTVYHDDDEAASLWRKIAGFSDDRIIRINTNDNFWSMGNTGPCGPSSEVFYDHGDHIPGGMPGTAEEDGDRFIEIWNLVFMQYEQLDSDRRILLPKKSVDTGMGLERISAIIQGVSNNYDIDTFRELIDYTESILKVPAKNEALFSYRIIADHLRSSAFLIADGVMPSNEGRGYVLRRIMRRAMRHAHQLGAKEPLMYKLLPKLINMFGSTYTELARASDLIVSILRQEEEKFKTTLGRGLKLLSEESANIPKSGMLSGEVAFKLYDTYGFPLDLTEDILKKENIKVDIKEFNQQMAIQKQRARKAWAGSGESKTETIWFDILSEFGATEFLGYSLDCAEGKVVTLVKNGKKTEQISDLESKFILVANQTPFYGESGGQMGDIGIIESANCKIKVVDTVKFLGKITGHVCELIEGVVKYDDEIKMLINVDYRNHLKAHHTVTHILHAVLRETLGSHVTQKGSLVAKDKLRFDISHPQAISKQEIKSIEEKVNKIITDNSKIITQLMPAEEAINAGAMALFGEKYDSEVRVVSLGDNAKNNLPYSFELCGGTHVSRTGDIGIFKITSEGAIASGIRRIEAVCGKFAFREIATSEELLEQISGSLKCNKSELIQKIDNLVTSKRELEKQIEKMQINSLMLSTDEIANSADIIKNGKLLYKQINDPFNPGIIRMAAENLAQAHDNLVVIFASKANNKLSLVISISKQISGHYNAGTISKDLATFVGGSGGGKALLAQAGGGNLSKLPELKQKILQMLA